MATLSDGEWQRVYEAWCAGEETVTAIAERFGVTPGAISYRRRRAGWPGRHALARRRAPDGAPVAGPATSAHEHVPSPAPAVGDVALPAGERGELIRRFYRLIDIKLGQMEADMTRRDDRTPADNERDARALGTLIRNFEKVFGLEQGERSDDDSRARAARGPRDDAAEAEAIRRELAERLVRLRKAGADERGGAGGEPG